MEEDIKILEEYLKQCEISFETLGIRDILSNEEIRAIRNLIARYKELKEKNKTLETLLQGNLYQMYLYYKELAGRYQANSISKDKVKEKIKELNLKLAEDVNGKIDATYNIRFTIQVLEELLVLED